MTQEKTLQNRHFPLLLLDVDGVISLFGFPVDARPAGQFVMVEGIPHLLAEGAAERLARLRGAFELAWCTGWEERANDHLVHHLKLPETLPVLSFDARAWRRGRDGMGGDGHFTVAHWKLETIDAFAGPQRPLAWIDDCLDEECARWAGRRGGPTLLVCTDPAVGMTDAHVEELLAWARTLGG